MAEETNTSSPHAGLSNTDLAFERTMLAHERTLMAWVRTAISMISFGFTLYKIFQEVGKAAAESQKLFTPRLVGMTMIGFAVLSLLLAQIQHQVAVKKLKKYFPAAQRSISSILSVLVLLFGFALFLAALMRQ